MKRSSILKETPEDRKERLQYSKCMTTKVVPNKKYKSRAKQKAEFKKEIEDV